MDKTPIVVPGLVLLLVASLLIAGCSTPDTADPAAQTPPPAGAGPLYKAGDIVRNPASTADTAWLVLGYDAASDSYERALVYPDAGGSWGYRVDSRTEKAKRAVMEKVYTEILANKLPSSIPIVTPTIITPEETTRVGITATTVSTTVPTAPSITKIFPEEGYAGTSVSVKNLIGDNFVAGTTVQLSRNGSTGITATDVRIVTNKSIICTFAIPSDAAVGAWDVTVRNPDGRSDTLTNIFTVHRDTSVVATTSSIFSGTVNISFIDPPFKTAGGRAEFIITGSKFQNGARVTLKKSGNPDIVADPVIVDSNTQIRFFVNIPSGSMGFWDIVVNNPDATYGKWTGGLEIRG